jgi:hypothetical protein
MKSWKYLSIIIIGLLALFLTSCSSSGETATIEFRQASAGDSTQQITVLSVNYAETGSYAVNLPEGTYDVIAMYAGTELTATAVSTGESVTIDFTTL